MDGLDAQEAELDLIAAYTRQNSEELEWRFDLFELSDPAEYDMYLALDTAPGGKETLPISTTSDISWEVLLIIPAHGEIQALHAEDTSIKSPAIRVVRDPRLDTLVLSMHLSILGAAVSPTAYSHDFKSQVFFISSQSQRLLDKSIPFSFDAPPPPPAHVFFAFWNVYPADTPLLALRRWDGAHTGPYGGRHGLFNLLRSAAAQKTSIALLDLKSPLPIYALDYYGNLLYVLSLVKNGQVSLCDNYTFPPGLLLNEAAWYASQIAERRQELEDNFDLPSQHIAYTNLFSIPLPKEYPFAFTDEVPVSYPVPDLPLVNPLRYQSHSIIPIRRSLDFHRISQATPDGPSASLKWALTQAQSKHPAVLIVGGSLPESSWGDAYSARVTLQYIKQHPWIKILSTEELISLPPLQASFSIEKPFANASPAHQKVVQTMMKLPESWAKQAAWNTLQSITSASFASQIQNEPMRQQMLKPVWSFINAYNWEQNPSPKFSCDTDINNDDVKDCLIANERFFALFEPQTGTLSFLLYRASTGEIHQIVAPRNQFILKLDESIGWSLAGSLARNVTSSPRIPVSSQETLYPDVELNAIRFMDQNGREVLRYIFFPSEARLSVSFAPQNPLPYFVLPIALDPWLNFLPGWWQEYFGFQSNPTEGVAGRAGYVEVRFRSAQPLTLSSFLEGLNYRGQMENPNQDYLPGVKLPFPMFIVELPSEGILDVMIK